MEMKKISLICVVLLSLAGLVCENAHAQLPDDFPGIEVTTYVPGSVGEGYIFLAVASITDGIGTYLMIIDNEGTPVWYEKLDTHEIYDFKVQPNGFLTSAPFIEEHSYTGGGDAYHEIRDENYNILEEIHGKNDYVAESHDFQILPNGNILQFGYYMSEVDMSSIVNNGHPGAITSGGVVQELDAQRNVVFQWRSWDYFDFETYQNWGRRSTGKVLSPHHLNDINQDPDGNIILGTPSEIRKINRQTGEIMWTLGGVYNEYTPVGEGADVSHFGGHATHRIENGNFLMYDNGGRGGGSSTIHEYTLDEVNKTATHVWSWEPPMEIAAWHRGNAQRLPNGNTVIGWGGASGDHIPACTEVAPSGEVVFELYFTENTPQVESYRAFRFPYPPATKAVSSVEYELAAGNEYIFTETGVTIDVDTIVGEGYNEVAITREPYAPVNPIFASSKAPRILPVRFEIEPYGIDGISAELSFDALTLGFDNPAGLTIYYRSTPSSLFTPIADTNYNPVTEQLRGTMTQFGEFIFCYPDVADVPYEPILNKAESYRGVQHSMPIHPSKAEADTTYQVNQELPILLSWSPKGLARWYFLEVATDAEFTALVVDQSWMNKCMYVFETAAAGTTYYWRVRINNDGGDSDWASGSFQTVAPMIEVTAPTNGESLTRGLDYFILWNDNIAEDVVIELYKSAAPVLTIGTVPSDRAFEWEVALALEPGCDYSIKIKSSTDETLFDMSETFSIDVPEGDFDCDGCVAMDDYSVLSGQWQKTQSGLAADIDGDNDVDLSDLAAFVGNWMTSCP